MWRILWVVSFFPSLRKGRQCCSLCCYCFHRERDVSLTVTYAASSVILVRFLYCFCITFNFCACFRIFLWAPDLQFILSTYKDGSLWNNRQWVSQQLTYHQHKPTTEQKEHIICRRGDTIWGMAIPSRCQCCSSRSLLRPQHPKYFTFQVFVFLALVWSLGTLAAGLGWQQQISAGGAWNNARFGRSTNPKCFTYKLFRQYTNPKCFKYKMIQLNIQTDSTTTEAKVFSGKFLRKQWRCQSCSLPPTPPISTTAQGSGLRIQWLMKVASSFA